MAKWTEEEDAYLRANYGRLSAQQCAVSLTGRTRHMVIGRADRLGLTQKGSPGRARLTVENVPRYKHRMGPMRSLPPTERQEPPMPQVNGVQKLHSRPWNDLEPGMCNWPVYIEQGTQMYCAGVTAKIPGGHDVYCNVHHAMSRQPRAERQKKYKQGVWAR